MNYEIFRLTTSQVNSLILIKNLLVRKINYLDKIRRQIQFSIKAHTFSIDAN